MQPVPEGYKPLGFAGFTDKGGYSESEVYAENDIVHKDNTAWRCLVNGTTGITPAEGENWTIFIASESDSSGITTTDTQGIVGIAGQKVSNQDIIDELAERAANQKENQFGTIDTFPVPGEPGIFYTDTETNLIYRWDAGSEEYVQVGGSESKAENMISDAFSTSKAYAVGDYAIYENTLYKFTSVKTAGAWDATKVQAVTVAGELNSLSEDLASANTQIDELNVNKVSYTQSGQVIVRKDFVLDKNAYLNAPIVLESVSGDPYCPGIGFHNPGKEGAALYLQGGSLILLKNNGEYYRLQMEYIGKLE